MCVYVVVVDFCIYCVGHFVSSVYHYVSHDNICMYMFHMVTYVCIFSEGQRNQKKKPECILGLGVSLGPRIKVHFQRSSLFLPSKKKRKKSL